MKFTYNYDKEVLRDKVCELLWDVGVKIENDELEEIMIKNGFKLGSNGRVKIPKNLIDDFVIYQKSKKNTDEEDEKLYSYYGVDFAHFLIWSGRKKEALEKMESKLMVAVFDCGPMKYYDYLTDKLVSNDTDIFIEMMKFAQATDDIGYISGWYRTDVPQRTERLDALILALQYTDKYDGSEAIYPEVIKYLIEISEIISGIPGDTRYLAGSECFTSPLIFEKRSSADTLERAKRKVKRYHIASMPTIGVASPLAVADSIVLGAAEILGGLVIANCVDPDSDLSGRMISDMLDMRSANTSCSMPDCAVVNLCVKDLFDTFWGGNLWVETFMGAAAKKPGLQAVYENLFGAFCCSFITGIVDKPYPLFGVLDKGGVGSPTQAILDIEIRKSQFYLKNKISINEDHMPWGEFKKIVSEGGSFLENKHTLDHFREKFSSNIFLTKEPWSNDWDGTEKNILDVCDNLWRKNIKQNYKEPVLLNEDKKRELQKILERAKRELL